MKRIPAGRQLKHMTPEHRPVKIKSLINVVTTETDKKDIH